MAMNIPRLPEVVSTDPLFANCKSIHDGYWGAQIYLGLSSKKLKGYGFKSKGEMPKNYKDFIRTEGAPSALRRDNALEEQSGAVDEIQREFLVKDQFSEAHNQQQNPVEAGGQGGCAALARPEGHVPADGVADAG